jgi:subtilase family serine protease
VTADHQIYIYVDGILAVSGTDDTRLAAGASQVWYWETQWPSDNASHTFTVVVDATNVVTESNENNNTDSIRASAGTTSDFSIAATPSSQTVTQGSSTNIYSDPYIH